MQSIWGDLAGPAGSSGVGPVSEQTVSCRTHIGGEYRVRGMVAEP